jgi:MFS family permease
MEPVNEDARRESLDPYAAGRDAPSPPVPTRLPASPVPYLWAWLVFALPGPAGLWQPLTHEVITRDFGRTRSDLGVYHFVVGIPLLLGLLWAYLSDRFPIMETRRVAYLVGASFLGALIWLIAPFVPWAFGPWLAISVGLSLAVAVARMSSAGALIELARRRRTTGRFAAFLVTAGWLAQPIWSALRAALGDRGLGWWAALAVVLTGSVLALALFMEEAPAQTRDPAADEPTARMGAYLRSRTFWSALVVLACGQTFSKAASGAVDRLQQQLPPDSPGGTLVLMAGTAAGLGLYLVLCRRWSLRALLVSSALLELICALLSPLAPPLLAILLLQLPGVLADTARLHLVMRAAPRGREALGYELLNRRTPFMPFSILTTALAARYFGVAIFSEVSPFIGAAGIVGLLAVFLLPRELVGAADGEPVTTPAVGPASSDPRAA